MGIFTKYFIYASKDIKWCNRFFSLRLHRHIRRSALTWKIFKKSVVCKKFCWFSCSKNKGMQIHHVDFQSWWLFVQNALASWCLNISSIYNIKSYLKIYGCINIFIAKINEYIITALSLGSTSTEHKLYI